MSGRVPTAFRILPLALVAASCGVGGGLVAAAGGGGGGGGGGPAPPPPQVVVFAPSDPVVSNLVRFSYLLSDDQVRRESAQGRPGGADDPRVRIRAQWQVVPREGDPEPPWLEMSAAEVPQSDGTRTLPLGQHTFVWNTLPDLGGAQGRFRIRARVLAEYEESSGLRRRFRSRDAVFQFDARLAGTVLGADVQPPSDLDTFPTDVRPDGDGFVVSVFGANVVERVDAAGLVRRLLGFGVPGDTVGSGRSPGVARLQTLVGLEIDGDGNLYTNHSASILVTNAGRTLSPLPPFAPVAIPFGPATSVPPFTVVRSTLAVSDSRDVRLHPTGVLLFLVGGTQLSAFNPGDASAPTVTLAGVDIAPGAVVTIAGGGTSTADGVPATQAQLADAVGVAVGPDGEVYVVERAGARVRVVNTGTSPLDLPGVTVGPAEIVTVAGTGTAGLPVDGGPAAEAQLNIPGAIDVTSGRALFIADTGNLRVRLVNLGPADVTFAETTVAPGRIDSVVGVGTGGVGSKARDLQLSIPNGLSLDAGGNLLIADERSVILVNGSTSSVSAYGSTALASRTARVYSAQDRGGVPLTEPRALHAASSTDVYFTDLATVRVMNLATNERVFGGEEAAPGGTAIVGGGSVPGYGGDGGSARSAAFSRPSALATQGRLQLFVADTGNDRVRLINVGDARLPTSDALTYLGISIPPGNVATVAGGPAAMPPDGVGDGLPPGDAALLGPEGVAVGPDGLLWICDTMHHRIRVVNPRTTPVTVGGVDVAAGTIRTIVGDGTPGASPDGPLPGRVNAPSAVVLDRSGMLYFAERGNSRIRCVNLSAGPLERAGLAVDPGEVRTLVGTGVPGNSGDGGDGPSARIDAPRSLALYEDDERPVALFFADEDAHVVRALNLTADQDLALSIEADGRTAVTIPAAGIFTVAGGPNTIGLDNAPSYAGDGDIAANVRFNAPFGIVLTVTGDRTAHFFVADRRNDRLRRFGAPPLVQTNVPAGE